MTFPLTPERLQAIAVSCVGQFINKQASLSEAIAKEAQDLELNSEQTKRVIEATNTIAHLRQLEKAADRTFEFPVADYDQVMASMCLPEDMTKVAEEDKDKKDEKDEDDKKDKKSDKKKDEDDEGDHEYRGHKSDEREEQEKKAMLLQGLMQSKAELTKVAYDKAERFIELSTALDALHKDPLALEKISFVLKDDSYLDEVLDVCNLEKRATDDSLILTNNELQVAKDVYSAWHRASATLQKEAGLKSFIERAEVVLFQKTANVNKLASIGTDAVSDLGRRIGSGLGNAAGAAGSFAHRVATAPGAFSRASASKNMTVSDGIKEYDKLSRTSGSAAAKTAFKGAKPSILTHRIGIGGIATALGGASLTHKNNIKDL